MMKSAEKFHNLLSEYAIAAALHDMRPKEQTDSIYQQIMDMIEYSQVETANVIRSLSIMLNQHNSFKLALLQIMRNIKYMSERRGGYAYPEFFWLIVESGILSEVNDINSIMTTLQDIASSDVIRAYLNYVLLTQNEANIRNIVTAYYYVGYSVESLKFVNQSVPFNQENLELYAYIYSNVMSFTYGLRISTISEDEKQYLIDFFNRGLGTSHTGIVESSQKALSQLERL